MLVDKTLSGSIAGLKMIKMTEPGIKHPGPGPALSLSNLYPKGAFTLADLHILLL